MTGSVLTLFDDLGDALPPATGTSERCGRTAASTGLPCMAWPRRGADACAFHITADELAAWEQIRALSNAAA